MPGLRLRHPTARSTKLIIPHPGGGEINRLPKDYHINVDNEGYAIVSETVYKGLQECSGFGFDHQLTFVNEVSKPPTQGLGLAPPAPNDIPNVQRVGSTRKSTPSSIENMKRSGIIPKGVTARITEHNIPTTENN